MNMLLIGIGVGIILMLAVFGYLAWVVFWDFINRF